MIIVIIPRLDNKNVYREYFQCPNNTYNIPFITNNNKFYKIKVQTAAEERKTQNETFWMTDYNTTMNHVSLMHKYIYKWQIRLSENNGTVQQMSVNHLFNIFIF